MNGGSVPGRRRQQTSCRTHETEAGFESNRQLTRTVRSTCPRDCYDGCGMLVHLEPGAKPRVSGDPDHPISRGRLCAKCAVAYNGVFQDEKARLTTPLRRSESGEFEAVSWDAALQEVAQRFGTIIDSRGPRAILNLNYTGTLGLIGYNFPSRLVNLLGLSQVDYGTICNAAGVEAWQRMFGTAVTGFDPRTASDSRCILVWGANPSHSAPHMHEHWLGETAASVVVIDPLRTESAASADLHLQPRPGTDAALAFSLLHCLRRDQRFDQDFIDAYTVGADELECTLDAATPEWGEQTTGVPAADIERAAALYGAGPALLWAGQGLQRQPLGGNIMRAIGLLPSLTGNVGKPGAGFYYLNDTAGLAGIDEDELAGTSLVSTETQTVGALDLAERLADPDEFAALLVWNANPLASCSNQQALRQACSRDDLLIVVADCFMTDTARQADIVLPAATCLEFDDIAVSYFNLNIGAQSKVCAPPGEALPNQEIFRRLATAMALDHPALFESDESMLVKMLSKVQPGLDFATLQQRGFVSLGGENALVLHSGRQFDTDSGRIEIAWDNADALGVPRLPHPTVDPAPALGELRLLSPASRWRLNDIYANDPQLIARSGPAELLLHPQDARARQLVDGDTATVSNALGSLTLTVSISDRLQPGVAVSYKGRWPNQEDGSGNINRLYAGQPTDLGASSAVHGLLVKVGPVQN